MDTNELRKAAKCIFIAVDNLIARDVSDKLNGAAQEIDKLRDELNYAERLLEECRAKERKQDET